MEDLPRDLQERAESMDPELRQRIEERAYALWEAEGRQEDRALEYWVRAEQEIGNESVAGEEDPLAGIEQQPRRH